MLLLQGGTENLGWVVPVIVTSAITVLTSIFAWSLSRNISTQDDKIKAQDQTIKDLNDKIDKVKDSGRDSADATNKTINDSNVILAQKINEILIKIAEMKHDVK